MMLNTVYFCAIFSLCCVSLSCPSYVSVQHVFWCYPYDVFSSVCISMLSSPCAVFQFSVYFHTILSMLCFSSTCISMLSSPCAVFQCNVYFQLSCPCYVSVQHVLWCCPLPMMCLVQRIFPYYPLLMICFSSVCISMLSSPYDVFS